MLQSLFLSGFALTILMSTSCIIKGKGTQRDRYETKTAGSGDASVQTPAEGEACLRLAEKRKKKQQLKLQDEGEEPTSDEPATEETAEEKAECPAADDAAAADDGATAEDGAAADDAAAE